MPKTEKKPLPLGRPRATKYLEIIAKRDGKRKAAQIEKGARLLAEAAGAQVVRFEFVADAAGISLDQMAEELREHGISTSPSNVKFGQLHGKNGTQKKQQASKRATRQAPKDGPGNAPKATAKKKASPTTPPTSSSSSKRNTGPDPKSKPKPTASGSTRRSASSRKPAASRGRAAGSSLSKSAQTRKLREQQVSARS